MVKSRSLYLIWSGMVPGRDKQTQDTKTESPANTRYN